MAISPYTHPTTDSSHMGPDGERIARLEVKLDYVIGNMTNLPPSPTTLAEIALLKTLIERHNAIIDEHATFIKTLKERIAWISAAFSVVVSITVYGIKYALEHANLFFGSK